MNFPGQHGLKSVRETLRRTARRDRCIADLLIAVSLVFTISASGASPAPAKDEDLEKLIRDATETMRNTSYHVEATLKTSEEDHISGDVKGSDWNLFVIWGDTSFYDRSVSGRAWASKDGVTWKAVDRDQLFYDIATAPITGEMRAVTSKGTPIEDKPAFIALERQREDGKSVTLIEIRSAAENTGGKPPRFWIVTTEDGKTWIKRFTGIYGKNSLIDIEYSKVGERIEIPVPTSIKQ